MCCHGGCAAISSVWCDKTPLGCKLPWSGSPLESRQNNSHASPWTHHSCHSTRNGPLRARLTAGCWGWGLRKSSTSLRFQGALRIHVWWEARGLREARGPWSLDALPARGARGGWGVLGLFATVPPGPWCSVNENCVRAPFLPGWGTHGMQCPDLGLSFFIDNMGVMRAVEVAVQKQGTEALGMGSRAAGSSCLGRVGG